MRANKTSWAGTRLMTINIVATKVASYGKQSLQNLENHVQNKITVPVVIGENGMNIRLQHKIQEIAECKMIPQQIRPTTQNIQVKRF